MRRTGLPLAGFAALALLFGVLLGGCGAKAEEKKSEPTTGLASGRTLVIATFNSTSHPEDPEQVATQTVVGKVLQERDNYYLYEIEASDPRVNGEAKISGNANLRADGGGELWGTWVLKNDGGTWDGTMSGEVSGENAEVPERGYWRVVAKGSGGYAGLELHLHGTGPTDPAEGFEPGTDEVAAGWIDEAK